MNVPRAGRRYNALADATAAIALDRRVRVAPEEMRANVGYDATVLFGEDVRLLFDLRRLG